MISLLAEGPMAERIRSLGCQVVSLNLPRGLPSTRGVLLLRRALQRFKPRVVQGWMYHGNLAAWVGARFLGTRTPVAWNIRQTLYAIQRERPVTRLAIRAGARMSPWVDMTVYNSEVARAQHEQIGYRPQRSVVIPNGFDLQVFRPSPEARTSLREELGLPQDGLVVGLVNRLHPMKGHLTFLEAARRVVDAGVAATFVCAGRDVTLQDAKLRASTTRFDLGDRVRFLGERADTPRLFAAFDITCMTSSWGEGFPNVVGESMSCGTPCVVTDVGDSKLIVGSAGRVVPPEDPSALADGIIDLLRLTPESRRLLGDAARQRVATLFTQEQCATRYQALYRTLAHPAPTRRDAA